MAERPRLSETVAARRHVIDGARQVVLHQASVRDAGESGVVGEREWTLLAAADGTRDLEGVLAAAARRGVRATREDLAAFVAALDAAGMIADGAAVAEPSVASDALAPVTKPIRALPSYRFHCDGRGSCCRLYPTTLFSAEEAARARALAPEVLDAGSDEQRAFTPERGSMPSPARAVAMIEGACAYLAGERRCLLHERGGACGKPRGCQLYPLCFVDDGESVRASVVPECLCAFASTAAAEAPLLAETLPVDTSGLDEAVHVRVLPATIALTADRSVPLAEYRALCDAWLESIDGSDAVAWLCDRAEALSSLPRSGRGPRGPSPPPPGGGPGRGEAALASLERSVRARFGLRWRSARDLAQPSADWLTTALARARGGEEAPASPESETFYLRAACFGHHLAGERPLAEELRARAARIVCARHMRALGPPGDDPAFAEPLALVEALARSYALR